MTALGGASQASKLGAGDIFLSTLKDHGVQWIAPRWQLTKAVAPGLIKLELEPKIASLSTTDRNLFVSKFEQHLGDEDIFKASLAPLSSSFSQSLASTNESIIRVLLGVAPIQASIISFLLVKLLDYELNEDDSVEQNIPRMILAQIKWLERVVDPPKLADGIIETLAAASVPVKKEIIGILPEILDDESSGKEVVRVLVEELERGGQLVPVVLDSLSTMQLDSDSSKSVHYTVTSMLRSAEPESLPVIVRFLLQSLDSEEISVTAKSLRSELVVESLNTSGNEDEVALLVDTIKTGLRMKKDLAKAILTEIQNEKEARDHHVLDVWLLFLMHSISKEKTKVESILKTKISNEQIRLSLLRRAVQGQGSALRELFPTLLSIAQMFVRGASMDQDLANAGTQLYQDAFGLFNDGLHRQEVLGTIISHLGSPSTDEVDGALNTLLTLVQDRYEDMKVFTVYLQCMLDFMDSANLTSSQIRKIYNVFITLVYSDTRDNADSGANFVEILLHKQMAHPEYKYQKMGIVGGVAYMARLGSEKRRKGKIKRHGENAPDEDIEKAKTMFKDIFDSVARTGAQMQAFFYDELVACINAGDLRIDMVREPEGDEDAEPVSIKGIIEADLSGTFLVDITEPELASPSTWYCLADAPSFALNIYPLATSPESHLRSKLNYLGAEFRLLQTAARYIDDGKLSSIDALLGCPLKMFPKVSNKEFGGYTDEDKTDKCIALSYAINWFREMINGFVTQEDPVMRSKLTEAANHLIEMELLLDSWLGLCPNFSAGKGKKTSKKEVATFLDKDTSVTNDAVKLVLTNVEMLGSKEEGIRPLDPLAHLLLTYTNSAVGGTAKSELVVYPYTTLYFLGRDLESKLEVLLAKKKRSLNPLFVSAAPLWLTGYSSKMECVRQLKDVFPVLAQYLRIIARDDKEDPYAVHCLRTLASCLSQVFNAEVLYADAKELLFEIASSIGGPSSQRKSTGGSSQHPVRLVKLETILPQCFEKFEVLIDWPDDLDTAVTIIDLLSGIAAHANDRALPNNLSEAAVSMLQKDWTSSSDKKKVTLKSQSVEKLLSIYLKHAPDILTALEDLTKDLAIGAGETGKNASWPTMNKVTTNTFYKSVFVELAARFAKFSLDDSSNSDTLAVLNRYCVVFKKLVLMTKSDTSRNRLTVALRVSKPFVDAFTNKVTWMKKNFIKFQTPIVEVMTSFQLGTRQLHNICSYSKEKKDVMLMKIVPNLKKSLETFIFAMKDVLAVNDVVGAFWLGNLRHRDISGIAVSSQLPVDEHRGDETPAVEDDAPSTKKRGRTKKTGRATATTADDKPSKPSKKKSKTSDKPKKSKKKKAESVEEVEEEEEAELEDIEEDVPEANRMHYEVADDDMDVDNNGYDEDDALAPILGIGESADDYGGFDEAVEFDESL